MNANDIPEVTPKDALGTMLMFKFPFKFVSTEQMKDCNLQFYRVRDDTLKSDFCRRQEIMDAYIWAIIDAYNTNRPSPCQKVVDDTSEFLARFVMFGAILSMNTHLCSLSISPTLLLL